MAVTKEDGVMADPPPDTPDGRLKLQVEFWTKRLDHTL